MIPAVAVFVAAVATASAADVPQIDSDLLNMYINTNLSYSCLPYLVKAPVAHCDCMTCSKDVPEFKTRMCNFFEEARKKGKGDLVSPNLVATCSSVSICPDIPNVCCDPSKTGGNFKKGCPLCLPSTASTPTQRGQNPACLLAEYEAASPTPVKGADWKQMYGAFDAAMRKHGLNNKCSSYVLFKTAKSCDCEDCLQNEKDLRNKWCKIGEEIRTNTALGRRGYLKHTAYYEKLCDFKQCPTIPQKCCTDPEKNVDKNGCPICFTTSEAFGFGPRCSKRFASLPQKQKLSLYQLQ